MHRTHVRRRRLTVLIGASIFVGMMTGPVAHAFSGPERPQVHHYVVQRGDSLWSIARTLQPDADPRLVIEEIQRANGVPAPTVVPGERLSVPAST